MPNEHAAPAVASEALRVVAHRHWMVAVPFRAALEWGSGKRPAATRLVVELELANGVRGYGETICLLDFIEPVLTKVVLPLAIGKSAGAAESLHRHVLGAGYYHHKRAAVMATCAVEMAMWDALGRTLGVPLCELWGGRYRERVEVAAYLFGTDSVRLRENAQAFLEEGYRTFRVKIGMSEATDLSNVEAVRGAIGALPLRADVNGAWTPGTARRQLAKLQAFDLAYVEQPLELDDLAGHAELRRAQTVPIALDESAYTLADVGKVVRAGAADVGGGIGAARMSGTRRARTTRTRAKA